MVHKLNELSFNQPILVRAQAIHALSPRLPFKKSPHFPGQRFFSEPWFGFCIL